MYILLATEVLETLHPWATGLCFIINVWLMTLTGLNNSLSTSKISEIMKNAVAREPVAEIESRVNNF